MDNTGRSSRHIRRIARFRLFRNMNCALATVDTLQRVLNLPDDDILAAATGFEGGCGGCGSTCGVITGGVLIMAQAADTLRGGEVIPSDDDLIHRSGEFSRCFLDTFGTTSCSERTGVDFHTLHGLLRYFLPGDRMLRCFSHIGPAAVSLVDQVKNLTHDAPYTETTQTGQKGPRIVHCAGSVLERINANGGDILPRIGRISSVFDGGVGLSGGMCGALAGCLLAVNVRFGTRVRQRSLMQTAVDFVIGHIHLIRRPGAATPDPYAIGKEIVTRFREVAGSVVCRDITGRSFNTPEELQEYHGTNEPCRALFDTSADLAEEMFSRWENR